MKVKTIEKLKAIKAVIFNHKFDDMPTPEASANMVMTTTDGVEVTMDKMEPGGIATINGMAAPANTYTFTDGSSITTDATGLITACTPAPASAPAPVPTEQAVTNSAPTPAPVATPVQTQQTVQRYSFKDEDKTNDGIDKLFASFATGTPEERITNLETCIKALMEYSFGWELRQAKEKSDRDNALKVYSETLAPLQQQMESQKKTIEHQNNIIKQMFEMFEEFTNEPTAENIDQKKIKPQMFTQLGKSKKGIGKYAAAMQEFKKEKEDQK